MSFPRLSIRLDRIEENVRRVVERCSASGISLVGVTKGLCGAPEVARAMREGGCVALADSRVENLRHLREARIDAELHLIRIPMASEMEEALRVADVILVSQSEALRSLDEAARSSGRSVEAILMVDLGDLREGIWPEAEEIASVAATIRSLRRVRMRGVGANLGCFGGVLPSEENLSRLVSIRDRLAEACGLPLRIVSGGATSSLILLEEGRMPAGVNQLRVGEAILLGADSTGMRSIPWLHQDTMVFEAQVVESRRKPSVPVGTIGADAFGNVPTFPERGIRRRFVVAAGRQDVRPEGLSPLLPGLEVLGASSDHLILDAEEAAGEGWGSLIPFRPSYGAMLAAATSEYVEKRFLSGPPERSDFEERPETR